MATVLRLLGCSAAVTRPVLRLAVILATALRLLGCFAAVMRPALRLAVILATALRLLRKCVIMPELKESPLSQIAVAGVILLKKAF